jgi:hypothetical protein
MAKACCRSSGRWSWMLKIPTIPHMVVDVAMLFAKD